MYAVEMVGPNGLRTPADVVEDGPHCITVEFDSVPKGFYTQLWLDEEPVIGFRTGFREGSYRAVIGWKPVVVEQRSGTLGEAA